MIIGAATSVAAVSWGVSDGDELKYEATKYTDTPFIIEQIMTVTFNVTFVDDYVTADMSDNGSAAVSVFLNTQSLDPDFGINIKTTNGIDIRFIADEQRIQSQMTQITSAFEGVLDNFSMSRVGNNLIISAHGSTTESSWTYDAKINYTSEYVLSSMSEDRYQTDGAVQTVLWTQVYHHTSGTTSGTTPTTTTGTTSGTSTGTTPTPELLTTIITGGSVLVIVVVVVLIIKRR